MKLKNIRVGRTVREECEVERNLYEVDMKTLFISVFYVINVEKEKKELNAKYSSIDVQELSGQYGVYADIYEACTEPWLQVDKLGGKARRDICAGSGRTFESLEDAFDLVERCVQGRIKNGSITEVELDNAKGNIERLG